MVSTDLGQASDLFWSTGACVVRGAVDRGTIDRAGDAVDHLVRAGSLADLSTLADSAESARFRAGVDHWRSDDEFKTLATTGPLPDLVAGVLRTDRLWLYEDSVLIKEAGSSLETKWHSDDGYFHVEGRQLATLWVPLDPAPLASGALRFLSGSHRTTNRYRPTLFVTEDAIPGTEGEMPPQIGFDSADVFGFGLEVGDCTIHHARTLHASSGNNSGSNRRALSIRYCGVDSVIRQKPGAPGKPGLDSISDGTPIAEAAETLGFPEASLGGIQNP